MYILEIKRHTNDPWVPGVQGTLNQTGRSDVEASSADTEADTTALLDEIMELDETFIDSIAAWRVRAVNEGA